MKRIPFLDASRGILACTVVASHFLGLFDKAWLDSAAALSVLGFFAMSGYVLALAYDGSPATFALRRVVRLWPTYAACLLVAYGIRGALPSAAELVWLPAGIIRSMTVDGPTWSLYAEAWATLIFPLAFAVPGRVAPVVIAASSCCLVAIWPILFPLPLFLAGVAASRFTIRWPESVPGWAEWLGKISFSLYLTHWVVLYSLGPWGVALVLPVAWACWWAIERPSIKLSRMIASNRNPTQPAPSGLPA